ncbi:hypothetical protein D047_1879A, partial [Vibrio parahaemolyticus VPTS-2010_2]
MSSKIKNINVAIDF